MHTSRALLIAGFWTTTAANGQPFYDPTPNWVSSDTPYSTGAALIDVDHDGWLDFVVSNGNDMRREELAVYYNQGDGTFPPMPDWLSADQEYNGHISTADVNADGWLDVAVGLTGNDPGTATARLYLNNAGTFSSTPDWEAPDELGAFHLAFGDLNGDGRPDLAVGTGFPYWGAQQWHNYVYLNTGGQLSATPSWTSSDRWDYLEIFFCDVDRDGWLDLVGVGTGTNTWVYHNDAGTLATTAVWHTTDNSGQFSVMGTYGDVNGDGWFELFVTDNIQLISRDGRLHGDPPSEWNRSARGGSGYLRRYDGLTGGYFTTTPTWSFPEGYGSAVALADIDADGDLDLASGSWWGDTSYFLNNGGGYGSTPSWSSAGTSVVEDIVFGDVNQDGLRWPVETFDASATPGRHLFQLSRQPLQAIESVKVDGTPLGPGQFTYDLVHGWVSVGPPPMASVEVAYVYTFSPDMAITNWDDTLGNYLYYNRAGGTRFGDFDDDGDVDYDDHVPFAGCFTGPGARNRLEKREAGGKRQEGAPSSSFGAGVPLSGRAFDPTSVALASSKFAGGPCTPGDADLDGDVDCADWERFRSAWTAGGQAPPLNACQSTDPVPAMSVWGILAFGLLVLAAGAVISRRLPSRPSLWEVPRETTFRLRSAK